MSANGKKPIYPQGNVQRSRPMHDPGGEWVETGRITPVHSGLTKRELFAAMAMQGMLAASVDTGMRGYSGWRAQIGVEACRYADSLLRGMEIDPAALVEP